jgi:delta-aminolevulinic acid dehydratase/porphobilinogen synthase
MQNSSVRVVLEAMTAFKRAGADIIITSRQRCSKIACQVEVYLFFDSQGFI